MANQPLPPCYLMQPGERCQTIVGDRHWYHKLFVRKGLRGTVKARTHYIYVVHLDAYPDREFYFETRQGQYWDHLAPVQKRKKRGEPS